MTLFRRGLRSYLRRGYLRELEHLLKTRAANDPARLVAEIETSAEKIMTANAQRFDLPSSAPWLSLASLVLASDRELAAALGADEARSLIGQALTGPTRRRIRPYLFLRFGITPWRPETAFSRIKRTMASRGQMLFGEGWRYEVKQADPAACRVDITRCAFNDFFRANGASKLISLFCALDAIWADEVSKDRYEVAFIRPCTLAAGADACQFWFEWRRRA